MMAEVNWKTFMLTALLLIGAGSKAHAVSMNEYTAGKVRSIIDNVVIPYRDADEGERIDRVSRAFLGTPYHENTLVGGINQPEQLVAAFNGVDCFTLLDYVYALTKSDAPQAFLPRLTVTRYEGGRVDYLNRRHFFTDWSQKYPRNATDITASLGAQAVVVTKNLNLKRDGGEYVPGLGGIHRQVSYIPAAKVTPRVLEELKTGDFVGIYSRAAGLDVSHVGIVIKAPDGVYFRNASPLANNRSVVDVPLRSYLKDKPGIVVLRPL